MSVFRKSSRFNAAQGTLNIASPFAAPGNLNRVVLSDIYGGLDPQQWPIDRSVAISIPAVSKARNLLISVIAPLPLVVLDETGPVAEQPDWLYASGGGVTTNPFEKMSWTIDDLIFTGYSLWTCVREDGAIVSTDYVPLSEWRIEGKSILVNDKPISEDECLFFNSPFEGLLTVGARKLREARDIETQIAAKVAQPIPLTVIRSTDTGNPLTQEEIDGLLEDWTKARRKPEGALGFLPAGLEIQTYGESDPAVFLEARNAIRTDIASFLALSASMLDGTSSIDSLTYVTKSGEASRFLNFDLNFWTAPIEARLSQNDVTAPGQRIRFDKSELINEQTPTGSPVFKD
jgi:hypothetical protein